MFSWWRYLLAFAGGMLAASAITLSTRSLAAPVKPNKPTGRQIVAFHSPQTTAVINTLARQMGADIVQIAPSGAYVLVVPKRAGSKLAVRNGRVRYIEPEIAMGIDPPAKELLLIVPIKWIPPELLNRPAKSRR